MKTDQSSPIKVQVSMSRFMYDRLREQSEELGFHSVPDYIRFWAKAAVDGRTFASTKSDLTLPEAQAVRFIELILATRHIKPVSLRMALEDVRHQLVRFTPEVLDELGWSYH